MNEMLFGGFRYDGLNNLGDHIQSIAAERLLPRIDRRFNRDTLSRADAENAHLTVMNGWFTHEPQNFPPSAAIHPLFWGFHVTEYHNAWDYFLKEEVISYLRAHEPIGCRDRYTADNLAKAGLETFYSKCLTLTLEKREKAPEHGWNIIVDVPTLLPRHIEENAIQVSHFVASDVPEPEKMLRARKLLNLYRDQAKTIITGRLHCALPAVAMGIPVVYLGDPDEYRTAIIEDIGLPIHSWPKIMRGDDPKESRQRLQDFWNSINWEPAPLDFEEQKKKLIAGFRQALALKLAKTPVGA